MTSNPSVTVVGLGSMGATLAHAYLKASYNLTIWNRTSTRPAVQDLVSLGATFHPDIADAIGANEIIVFCLVSDDALNAALAPVKEKQGLKGKIVINLTNGTPNQARSVSEWMIEEGVKMYIDGGIMATPEMIGTPASKIFVSGVNETEVEEGVKNAIAVLGAPVWFGTDHGAASLHDLAMLAGMYGMFAGAITSLALLNRAARREGENGTGDGKVVGAKVGLLKLTLQELLPLLDMFAYDLDEGNVAANGFPMEMQRVAVQNILRACEEEGIDGGLLRPMGEVFEKVVGNGGGEEGLGRVMELVVGGKKWK